MRRSGFTLIEMLIVITLIGVVGAMAFPKWHTAYDHENVRAARREALTQLNRAKGTAVQRGCRATIQMRATGTKVWVEACRMTALAGSTTDTVGFISLLSTKYGVTMTTSADSLPFAPTSLGLGTATITMTFTKNGYTSTLTVTSIGRATWQ